MSVNAVSDSTDATGGHRSAARYFPTAARLLMGLMFLIFGLNGLHPFMPMPKTPLPAGVLSLLGAWMKTGYFIPMVFATQTIVGVLLLVNVFVPLALALIAPVIVNILLFHLFLQPSTIAPGIVVTLLEIYLAWCYRDVFRPMLAIKAKPITR